jgi:PAS domain S-box-containing protein
MNSVERSQLLRILRGRRKSVADSWHEAMATTGTAPISPAEVRRRLADLTAQVVELLVTDEFDPGQAEAIGASLASLHRAHAEALGRTQELLAHGLFEGLPADQVAALQPRLSELLGRLGVGFCQQVAKMILQEQERLRDDDASELQPAQEILAREADLLRTLIENLPDSVYVKDTEGRFVIGNRATASLIARVTGAPVAEAYLGTTDFDYFPAEVAGQFFADEQEIIRSGQAIINRESSFMDPATGSTVWVSSTKVPVRNSRGEVVAIVGISRDTTKRKQAQEELSNHRRSLERQVSERTAQLSSTVEQLQAEIAERQRASKALRESEEKYRRLIERANDGVAILQGANLEYANPRLGEMWGGAVQEMIGTPFSEYVHPDELAKIVERYQQRMAGQTVTPIYETVLRRKDGSALHVELNAGVITYDGEPADLVIVRDITERRDARDAVQRSERLYRAAIEAGGAVPYSRNYSTNTYEFIGPGIEALTGYPAETFTPELWDAMAREIVLLGPVRDLSYQEARQRARSEEGLNWRADYRIEARDGSERWVANSAVYVRDERGRAVRSIGILHDITERVQAKEALHLVLEDTARSHRLVLALSQAAQAVQRARTPEAIYRTLSRRVKQLGYHAVVFTLTEDRVRLTIAHLTFDQAIIQSVERLTGLSGRDFDFLRPGGFLHRAINEQKTLFTDQTARYIADTLPEPRRHLAHDIVTLLGLAQSIVAPLVAGRETFGLLAVTGDGLSEADAPAVTAFASQAAIAIENTRLLSAVTEHGRELQSLSAQLISAHEAERSRISQELHDEMGQSLTAMRINLAAVEEGIPPESPPMVRERLAETSWLVKRTLKQMRDLSQDLRPGMLDDLGLVPTVEWYVSRYAKRLDVAAEFEAVGLEERLPTDVETVLYRVVQEALTNVAKHAQAGRVRVGLKRSESTVTASVEDNGRGFNAQDVAERETTERGIGLIGMRERATSLGGTFRIQSHPGKGTRLTVEIPLRAEQIDEPQKGADP